MALQPPPHEGDFDSYAPLFPAEPEALQELLGVTDLNELVESARARSAAARERRRERKKESARRRRALERSKYNLAVSPRVERSPAQKRRARPPEEWGTQELVDYFEEMWLRRTLGKESLGWKPVNRRALGASIKRWRSQQVRSEHIKAMMDAFASPVVHPVSPDLFPWAVFVGRFEVLYRQGKNLLQSQKYRRQHEEAEAELQALGGLREPRWTDIFQMTQERELYPASHPGNRRVAHPSNSAWSPYE